MRNFLALVAILLGIACAHAAGPNQEPAAINGCIYNATPFTLADKQHASFSCDVNGKLLTSTTVPSPVLAPLNIGCKTSGVQQGLFPYPSAYLTFQGCAADSYTLVTLDNNGYMNRTFDANSGRIDLWSTFASGNSAGPAFTVSWNPGTASAGDSLGHYAYRGEDSNGTFDTYAYIDGKASGVTAAGLNSQLLLGVMQNQAAGAGNAQPNWFATIDGGTGTLAFTSSAIIGTSTGSLQLQAATVNGILISASSGITTQLATKVAQYLTANKTSAYPVVAGDMGTVFTNIGAAGEVDFTLPTGLPSGNRVTFVVGAAQTLKIIAPASTTIRCGGTVSAAAGNATATAVGSTIELVYFASLVSWLAISTPTGAGGSTSCGGWTVT